MTSDTTLPGLDDLDDLTLHEPVTKENDMNEARASATALEPADTKAVMEEFRAALFAYRDATMRATMALGAKNKADDVCAKERDVLEFVQCLIPVPSEPAKCAAKIHPERFIREAADKAAVWSSDCRNIRVLPMSALDTILIHARCDAESLETLRG